MEVDGWTRAIAIYGAVLSTAGGIFQFVRHHQDKPRVKVYMEFVEGEPRDAVGQGFDPYFKLIATNVGRQPVTVKAVREYQEDDRFELLSNPRFERKLEASEESYVYFPLACGNRFAGAKRVTVLDSEGREWPFKKMKLFREQHRHRWK